MKTKEIITYMRKLFVIISFVAFISCFMILSGSCGRQSMHETLERFEEAQSLVEAHGRVTFKLKIGCQPSAVSSQLNAHSIKTVDKVCCLLTVVC